jgi:hypothetical protein
MIIDGLASFILFFYMAKAEHNNENMIRIKKFPESSLLMQQIITLYISVHVIITD